ncbi:MAG: TfoX/Sxy family protein [Euryarchaeota archaeon]|nr:TfoX/Sxy family protein [Euryarchaeota archaeon]
MAKEDDAIKVTPARLAQSLGPVVGRWGSVSSRKMFGGTAFFVGPRIFCFVWKQGLVVKLGEARIEAMIEALPGSERFSPRPSATGPSKQWAQVPFKYLPSDMGVGWIREAFEYAASGKEERATSQAAPDTKKGSRSKKRG